MHEFYVEINLFIIIIYLLLLYDNSFIHSISLLIFHPE